MKKLLFPVLLALLIGCGVQSNSEKKFSEARFNKFITKAPLVIDLEEEGNGKVKFTMTNNKGLPVSIFIGDTPFEGFEKNLFKIYDGDQFLSYKGRYLHRKESPSNWVRLDSGESKEAMVMLENAYEFPEAKDYDIYFDSFITVKTGRDIQIMDIVSNTIITSIIEPTTKLTDIFQKVACSTNNLRDLDAGKDKGKDMTINAINYLDKYGAEFYYTKWFGEYTSNRFNKVVTGFNRMETSFGKSWDYSCETIQTTSDCRNYWAWVYSNRPYEVWVCMNQYNDANLKDQGSLMIHEATHWNITFGSADHTYGYQNGINLAKKNPDKAIDCANNIEYYAWDIPNIDDPPIDDPEVKLNKQQYKVGERIVVTYSDFPGNNLDWISIYEKGASDDQYGEWFYTDGQKSGTMTFQGLTVTGNYEVRAYSNDSYNMMTSVSFKVTGDDPPIDEPEIKLDKKKYAVGERIVVTYSDLPGNKTDWIGIYEKAAADDQYMQRFYTDGQKNGTMTFNGLEKSGDYEMRLYFNDSYDLELSESFEVVGDDPPAGDEEIKIDKTTFDINELIKVKYSGLDEKKKYEIGAFPRGTSDNDKPIKKRKIKKSSEGIRRFKIPTAGKYEFHLYIKKSDIIIDKVNFVIDSDAPPPEEASFKLNKDVYKENEQINVIYTDLPGNKTDWIGIFDRGAPHEEYQQWFYTNGKKEGTMVFNGLPAGKYDMRLFFNDSYDMEFEVKFKVEGGQPPQEDFNIYYGHLHNHSNLSDGTGSPASAYTYARDKGKLDFFGLADHDNYLSDSDYSRMKSAANSYNKDGSFVTFYGFEWTHDSIGHVAIINSSDFCKTSNVKNMNQLSAWLSNRNTIAFFNHPGREPGLFNNFNFNYTDRFVGIELWNKNSGFSYYNKGYYDQAIKAGWYIGASGSDDNHYGTWGTRNNYRMAILSKQLTRNALYAAMVARRFFSTADKNLKMFFTINKVHMGSRIDAGTLNIEIKASDGNNEAISTVRLYKNGSVIKTWKPENSSPTIIDVQSGKNNDYFYIVIVQSDKDMAVSSPIYIK